MSDFSSTVLSFVSGKGGVGKTVITSNIGKGLSLLGRKTVLIDLDFGLRNLDIALGVENNIVFDLSDVFSGKKSLYEVMVSCGDNLFFIPASQAKKPEEVDFSILAEIIEKLRGDFDYILIDCPSSVGNAFYNAVSLSDRVCVVSNPDKASLRDADKIFSLISTRENCKPSLIINKIRLDLIKKNKTLNVDDILDILKVPLLGIIPFDDKIFLYAVNGEMVVNQKNSLSGECLCNISKRIIGEIVPLKNFSKSRRFKF